MNTHQRYLYPPLNAVSISSAGVFCCAQAYVERTGKIAKCEQKAIEKAVLNITIMSAAKKRDEALTMPDKFFPQLEAHLGQVRK